MSTTILVGEVDFDTDKDFITYFHLFIKFIVSTLCAPVSERNMSMWFIHKYVNLGVYWSEAKHWWKSSHRSLKGLYTKPAQLFSCLDSSPPSLHIFPT